MSRQPQKLYRSVFENAGVAIAVVDEDGTVTCVATAEEYGQRRKWVKVRRSNFTLARKE